jgi:putative endonuclease
MNYFIYILHSQSKDRYYTGYSQNPEARLIKHNLGSTPSSRTGRPWTLVHKEEFDNKRDAFIREAEIKGMKSRKYIESLIGKDKIG